jgi:hypothetical protein
MISRREVVTAGVLGTLATASHAEAGEVVQEVEALRAGFKMLDDRISDLKTALEQGMRGPSTNYGAVGAVRSKIEVYARTSGRFPEYCDIGLSIFHDVYDWHVRYQQQIQISRIADQRMAIQFMFTQLVLRWENEPGYIGTPYDR